MNELAIDIMLKADNYEQLALKMLSKYELGGKKAHFTKYLLYKKKADQLWQEFDDITSKIDL